MYKYTPDYTVKFRRNRRVLIKRAYDMSKLEITIDILLKDSIMPPEYRDHPLKGKYNDYRECHVNGEGDLLLIYKNQLR